MNRYTNNPKRLRKDIFSALIYGAVASLIGYFAITNFELFFEIFIGLILLSIVILILASMAIDR